MKKKQAELERELNEKVKEIEVHIIPPPAQTIVDYII